MAEEFAFGAKFEEDISMDTDAQREGLLREGSVLSAPPGTTIKGVGDYIKFGGDGSDGVLDISSGTTTIALGGARVVTKNYTYISITGTGALAFSGAHANGTFIILKSQGPVVLTSTASAAIDVSSLGASGGTSITTVITAGNNGTSPSCGLFRCNGGTGGPTSGTAAGGVVATFLKTYITPELAKYPYAFVGAGGGSGSNEGGADDTDSGAGGNGGGCLIIECGGAYKCTGTLKATGGNGGNGTGTGNNSSGAGGGGGAGGYIAVFYDTLDVDSGTYTVTAGTGGNNNSGGADATTVSGGGGGASSETAGSSGTESATAGAKTGGDGAVGASLVTQNLYFA